MLKFCSQAWWQFNETALLQFIQDSFHVATVHRFALDRINVPKVLIFPDTCSEYLPDELFDCKVFDKLNSFTLNLAIGKRIGIGMKEL